MNMNDFKTDLQAIYAHRWNAPDTGSELVYELERACFDKQKLKSLAYVLGFGDNLKALKEQIETLTEVYRLTQRIK